MRGGSRLDFMKRKEVKAHSRERERVGGKAARGGGGGRRVMEEEEEDGII